MRELLEIVDGRTVYSSLYFDVHDLVYQLANVDYVALDTHLASIQHLRTELDRVRPDRKAQRDLTQRLGRELEAAPNILRPSFVRR